MITVIPEEIKNTIKDGVDVESLLIYLGFKIDRSNGYELRAPCVIHGGDNPTAFSLKIETRKWKCFTKHCEQTESGKIDNDLISLIMKTQGLPFIDALQFLSDFAGLGIDVRRGNFSISPEYEESREIKKFIKKASKLRAPKKEYNLEESTILDYKIRRDAYFIERGFLTSTLDHFGIGSTVSWRGIPSASIPIRDKDGKLVGLSLRRTDCDEDPRYDLEYRLEKDRFLYNLSNALAANKHTVIIVEGFKACWAVYEAGYSNVVACMGDVITEGQLSQLMSSGITGCVLMLDGDEAGRDGMVRSTKKLENAFRVIPAYLDDGVSPDDLPREELKEFLNLYVALV